MKATKKLLKKLTKILDADDKKQQEKSRSLKKVLKSLRMEKKRLEAELELIEDPQEREEVSNRLKVISVQRKKGLKLLKELKESD